jgi:hypothetical protein
MEICPLWSIEINIVSGRVENNCQRADSWPCKHNEYCPLKENSNLKS